jgi:peptidoglycan DL-endopeptidase CwlO
VTDESFGRRGRNRSGGRSARRTATIAAVATGTIAASSAAFAATGPGGSDMFGAGLGASVDTASLAGGPGLSDSGAPSLLGIAQVVGTTEPTSTGLTITPATRQARPNAPVLLTVRATRAGSLPLAGQAVRILVADGSKWVTTAVLHTDAGGTANITAHLLTTTRITVAFDGTGVLRPASATPTVISIVTPAPPPQASDTGITTAPSSTIGSKAVYLVSLQQGKPYVWGATGPNSFDCSGLTQYVYRQLGRWLPRTTDEQYAATVHIAKAAKQPGDLIFFGSPGNMYHMGIYAGNGYIWHAPQTGEVVQLVPLWTTNYYVTRVM